MDVGSTRLSRQGRDDEGSEEPKAASETPLAALATVETEKTPNLRQPFDSDEAGKTANPQDRPEGLAVLSSSHGDVPSGTLPATEGLS
jgi:hypothetical protein